MNMSTDKPIVLSDAAGTRRPQVNNAKNEVKQKEVRNNGLKWILETILFIIKKTFSQPFRPFIWIWAVVKFVRQSTTPTSWQQSVRRRLHRHPYDGIEFLKMLKMAITTLMHLHSVWRWRSSTFDFIWCLAMMIIIPMTSWVFGECDEFKQTKLLPLPFEIKD